MLQFPRESKVLQAASLQNPGEGFEYYYYYCNEVIDKTEFSAGKIIPMIHKAAYGNNINSDDNNSNNMIII